MGVRRQLAKRRKALGYSQERLAEFLAVDRVTIGRWERGETDPLPYLRPRLAKALRTSPAELEALLTPEDDRPVPAPAGASGEPWRLQHPAEAGTADIGEEDPDMDRRKFLEAAAVAAAGTVALSGIAEARQGIDAALSGSDAGDLAYLDGAFERHRGGYRGRPPTAVLAQMRGDLNLLRDVLNRPHAAGVRADLARTTAGITGLVAIIQHDRSDQRDSHGWFTTAQQAARESGDRQMLAWTLARHAMVPLNYGAPRAAADLATRARAEAGLTPSAAAALAAAVTARALASTGDQQGALEAVADARAIAEHLDGTQVADTWFGYPQQKHHVHLSQAFTLLGRTREAYAEQEAALALTRSPSVMTRALLEMDAATCLNADGDPAAAADKAVSIWEELPEAYRDGLVRSRAETLHHMLPGAAHTRLGEALAG